MNVYTSVDHEGLWVGVASMVVAENEDEARKLLIQELATQGIKQEGKPFTLRLMNIANPRAYVLQNGDY